MKGKKRGVMILKNGGESGNVGGNLISKMTEFTFLLHQGYGSNLFMREKRREPTFAADLLQ